MNTQDRAYYIISVVLAGVLAAGCSKGSILSDSTINPSDKAQIESVMHDYLLHHPEIIMQAMQNLEQKNMQDQIIDLQTRASEYVEPLFHAANDPVAGNPNGKITLVAFFDYQCPHCSVMTPIIADIIKSNPDLRVVMKDLPIFGPISVLAAQAGLAAGKENKYFAFHQALMKSTKEPLTKAVIYQIATSVGLDVPKLKADMKNPAIAQQIKANYDLASALHIEGTPAFFIAKSIVSKGAKPDTITVIPGETSRSELESVIKNRIG